MKKSCVDVDFPVFMPGRTVKIEVKKINDSNTDFISDKEEIGNDLNRRLRSFGFIIKEMKKLNKNHLLVLETTRIVTIADWIRLDGVLSFYNTKVVYLEHDGRWNLLFDKNFDKEIGDDVKTVMCSA